MQQHIATAQSSGRQEAPALAVGLDVDDRHIQVCVLDPEARVVREQRVRTTALALVQALGDLPSSRVGLRPPLPLQRRTPARAPALALSLQCSPTARRHRRDCPHLTPVNNLTGC